MGSGNSAPLLKNVVKFKKRLLCQLGHPEVGRDGKGVYPNMILEEIEIDWPCTFGQIAEQLILRWCGGGTANNPFLTWFSPQDDSFPPPFGFELVPKKNSFNIPCRWMYLHYLVPWWLMTDPCAVDLLRELFDDVFPKELIKLISEFIDLDICRVRLFRHNIRNFNPSKVPQSLKGSTNHCGKGHSLLKLVRTNRVCDNCGCSVPLYHAGCLPCGIDYCSPCMDQNVPKHELDATLSAELANTLAARR